MAREQLQQLQAEVFGSVFVLAQYLARRADDTLAPLGLTTKQWLLLAVLTKRFPGDAATLTEAAEYYGSSRQNVKKIAEQLAERGYLKLRVDPHDARRVRLEVTDKIATFASAEFAARQTKFFDMAFAGMALAELGALQRQLQHLLKNVEPR